MSPHSTSFSKLAASCSERVEKAHRPDGVVTPNNHGIVRITPSNAKPFKCPRSGCGGRRFATQGSCNKHYGKVHKRRIMSEDRDVESEEDAEYYERAGAGEEIGVLQV